MPLPRENTIVVTCDKAMKPSVLDVLSKLDVPPRQVEISAKIFEVSQDFDYQHGAQMIANRWPPIRRRRPARFSARSDFWIRSAAGRCAISGRRGQPDEDISGGGHQH
jgi:hypothetical protein